jgi:hypothetical protein
VSIDVTIEPSRKVPVVVQVFPATWFRYIEY